MGRIFGRIFGFSDFSGLRAKFGHIRSVSVLHIRAVFPNAGMRVQDRHYGLILVIFWLNSLAAIFVIFYKFFRFRTFSSWSWPDQFMYRILNPRGVFRMPGWEFRHCIIDGFLLFLLNSCAGILVHVMVFGFVKFLVLLSGSPKHVQM